MNITGYTIPRTFFAGIALSVLITTAYAQDNPEGARSGIEACGDKLDAAIDQFSPKDRLHHADLVFEARAQIKAAESLLAEKPDSKDTERMTAVCSLAVEAARGQLALVEARAIADSLRAQLNTARSKLNDTHKQILATQQDLIALERRTASRLKADLDIEKRKAEKLREEAEKKFSELQSELISVKKDARGTIISMSDILFDVNKATLTENLKTNLAKISGILTVFKKPDIVVEGHTDNQGTAEYNQKLSESRAENVMNFMIEQGIAESRLSSVGYGLTRPVADNSTREGRSKNRRVDLIVKDKE